MVRVANAIVLSFMSKVLDGSLGYATPPTPFVPGSNAVGVVQAVGGEVSHVRPGDFVFLSPHCVQPEPSKTPPQILIGLTALGSGRSGSPPEGALRLQRTWRHGVFAEIAHWPAACVTPLDGFRGVARDQWIALAKLLVPYGGLLRAGVCAGNVVAINGASGFYGSAGVMVALALGASKVVAVGRDEGALAKLAHTLGPRVSPVALAGTNLEADVEAVKNAAGGDLDVALDIVGQANSTTTTSAILRSLRRGGRLVLMGSASAPLEVSFAEMLSNDWEVVGNFMYPPTAPAALAAMLAQGLIDVGALRFTRHAFKRLPDAIQAASSMRDLDLVTVEMDAEQS